MSRNFILPLREAIVSHLKADASFTAKQSADAIHGMRQPAETAWPFTRYGGGETRAAGLGEDVTVTLHNFSKGAFENECAEIQSAMVESLDGKTLALESGVVARLSWRNSQLIPDAAEANAWHGITHFAATIAQCA
jgi:hypothetical protein